MSDGIPTERMTRIAESAARAAVRESGEIKMPHACDKETRIAALEAKSESQIGRITDIEKQLIRMEAGFNNVAGKVSTLNVILAWVGSAIGLGLLGTAGAALLYVIALMGHKP